MLILTCAEIEKLLDPHELLDALEEGFKALSANQLNVPPRNQAIITLFDSHRHIYKSMGYAMEDLLTTNLVYQKAIEQGVGKIFEL